MANEIQNDKTNQPNQTKSNKHAKKTQTRTKPRAGMFFICHFKEMSEILGLLNL